MVLLLVDIIDSEKQHQEITCTLKSVEDAFDVVSYLSTQADQIQAAYLIEKESPKNALSLPIEAFDGYSFSVPVKQLKKEWEKILSRPTSSKAFITCLTSQVVRNQIVDYDRRVELLQGACKHIQQINERIRVGVFNDSRQAELLRRNESMLALYRRQLADVEVKREKALRRLNQCPS